jgi:hypothetical protein
MCGDATTLCDCRHSCYSFGHMLQITLYPETHTYHITKAGTDGKYAMLEIASLSGNGSLLHSHSKEAEVFYVIDGEFLFQYRK